MRTLLLSAILSAAALTQSKAQTIFTYGGTPVSESEFLKVYKKNNTTQSVDYSDKALRDYIDLYSLFRMKVQEANKMQLDTTGSVALELDNYRKQLARTYLTDDQVTAKLVEEAYNRSKEEIHVAHIVLMAPPQGDTVAVYRKIDSIYNVIVNNKGDFAALAREYSEDKGSKKNGGDVNFITALQTVYPFENVVYATPVGKVSKPFRTQFGYHIVKVIEKRPARGEIKVAQILLFTPKSAGEAGVAAARLKMDSVVAQLKKGASFESLVKKYSEDKYTVDKNGELPPFATGKMVPAFDQAAFALKNPGDISKPIETDYGIHLIKLLEKYPPLPFDSVKKELKARVDKDSRAQTARDHYFEKVKQSNGFKENPQAFESLVLQLKNIPDTGKKAGMFTPEMFKNNTATLFTLGGKNYVQSDFVSFAQASTRGKLSGSKEGIFRELYNMYQGKVVNDFQEHKLVDENPEFKSLMQEYRDGIMLFELMDRNVWGKASKDSAGLQAFYESQKNKYMWEPGFKGSIYTFSDEAAMKEGVKLLAKKDMTNEEIVKTLNNEKHANTISIQTGHYEFNKFTDIPQSKIVAGKATEAVKKEDKYVVIKADEVFTAPVAKTFMEARGYIISGYQDSLEKNWNAALRAKYPVKINEEVLQKIVK